MELNKFYEKHYRSSNESRFVTMNHNYSHRKLEVGTSNSHDQVLELGAGNGEHLQFVQHLFKKYILSDIRSNSTFSSNDPKVVFQSFDVQNIPHTQDSFDRVVATCLLHHVPDVHLALSEMRRVCKNRGLISINIAADPGVFYRFMWTLTSGKRLKREGIKFPKSTHYQEHKGHYIAIREILTEVFCEDEIKLRFYPFSFLRTHQLNIFAVAQIRVLKG